MSEYQEVNLNDPESNTIKKILLYQGNEVCRYNIASKYIKDKINKASFTFIHYGTKAQKYYVHSFILCTPVEPQMIIDLVCSRPKIKEGEELIKLAENKAKELNINYMALFSLPEKKLLKWYEKLGYVNSSTVYDKKDLKAYYMTKKLI